MEPTVGPEMVKAVKHDMVRVSAVGLVVAVVGITTGPEEANVGESMAVSGKQDYSHNSWNVRIQYNIHSVKLLVVRPWLPSLPHSTVFKYLELRHGQERLVEWKKHTTRRIGHSET